MAKLAACLALCLLLPAAYAAQQRNLQSRISLDRRDCTLQLTEQACLDHHCFFCESKPFAGFTGCFETSDLASTAFYSCKGSKEAQKAELVAAALRKRPANPSDPCEGKPDAKSCDALDECTWCKSAAVPSSCFTLAQAKFLPPAVFVCDKKPPAPAGEGMAWPALTAAQGGK